MDIQTLTIIMGICIFTAAVGRMFDKTAGEYSVMLKTAVAAGILAAVVKGIIPAAKEISSLYSYTGGSGEYLTILFKSLGICFLTQLAADICRDSGEGSLALQAETAGRTALLILSLPLFKQAALIARELIY